MALPAGTDSDTRRRAPSPRRAWAIAACAFVAALAGGEALVWANEALHAKERDNSTRQLLAVRAAGIERGLSFALAATYILAQEIIRSDGDVQDFDGYAASVLQQLPDVSNLQLAPGGVIERIHPLAGNEAAIGHDVLRDDARRAEARAAVRSAELTLAGPFELLQGGIGMVGRNPVFLERGGEREFWGFASALILLDDLLERADVASLEAHDHAWELARVPTGETEARVFAHGPRALPGGVLEAEVRVPNGSWTLRAASLDRGSAAARALPHALALLVAGIVAALVWRSLREPVRLRAVVAERTLELRDLAYTDPLTGLPNRLHFMRHLGDSLAGADDAALHLMLLDVDRFKEVNDVLGHDVGDRLLVEAAARIRARLPDGALLARLGGDEFTIVLAGMPDEDGVDAVARGVVDALSEPFRFGDDEAHVSASIGIVARGMADATSQAMLKAADVAMYEAKRLGRAQFARFTEPMHRRCALDARLAIDLRHAVALKQLEIVYTPIRGLLEDRVLGAETHLRWNHPELGCIEAAEFLPIAERTGHIVGIAEWVFRGVSLTVRAWRGRGAEGFRASLDVSRLQLRSPRHVDALLAQLDRIALPGQALVLRINEEVVPSGDREAHAQLARLRATGMMLALDDFGAGRSSLTYLEALGVGCLRIERAFVAGLERGGAARVPCRAIAAIARELGLPTIAEGVATTEQCEALRSEGCDRVQGPLVGEAVVASEFERRHLDARVDPVPRHAACVGPARPVR